jgi:hypothetical protein
MAKHAKLCPPSGWDRWSNCSASVDLQTGGGSEFAAEGTAAHLLGDTCFQTETEPHDWIGQIIWVPDDQDEQAGERELFIEAGKEAPLTGWTFEVDMEMADHVKTYMDEVRMQPRDYMQSETAVPIGHITGEEDASGHADVIRIHGKTLATHDLKYGQGVKVFAKDNGQQVHYLLGAIKELEWYGDFDKFEVHIHQPRLGHHDVWYLSREELTEWAKKINKVAYAIVVQGRREFGPSTKGCKFCDYRKECEARASMAAASVQDFPEYELEEEPEDAAGKKMAEILDRVEFLESWIKDMWTKANQMAEENPGSIPGWDMFPGRGGRKIRDEKAEKLLKSRLRKHGYKVDQYMPRKLKSPAQIEKEVGKEAYNEWVADLVEKTKGTPKLGRAKGDRKTSRQESLDAFTD